MLSRVYLGFWILPFALLSLGAKAPKKAPQQLTVKRPAWVRAGVTFGSEDGRVFALGKTTTMPGVKTDEGYIIASNHAREVACKAIEHRIDFIFQNSEEGSTVEPKQLKEFTMELCTWFSTQSERAKRYWEKVLTTASNGDRVQVYHIFVTEAVSEDSFRKKVIKLIKSAEGKNGVEKGSAKSVQSRWQQFIAGE